jgi:hypothetical protein
MIMGCDIHCITQIKQDDLYWETVEQLDINRDYELFNILASVRGNGSGSISSPRGLPNDFYNIGWHKDNYDDLKNSWYLGEHSFSYVTLKELINKKVLKNIKENCWCSNEKEGIFKFINDYSKAAKKYKIKLENIRIVFGFDS